MRSAAASGLPDALVEATDRFERLGAWLLAAEAATEAAQAYQRHGDRRAAAAAWESARRRWPSAARVPGRRA